MPTNVEIKARISNIAELRARAEALSGQPPRLLRQVDTFFNTSRGRLKLRVMGGGAAELIYYEREDGAGPRPSAYHRAPISDPESLQKLLAAWLGIRGVVRKEREYFLAEDTRIHLDQVDSLGSFLELEVMLAPGKPIAEGRSRAVALMKALGVDERDLVDTAYIDLLARGA